MSPSPLRRPQARPLNLLALLGASRGRRPLPCVRSVVFFLDLSAVRGLRGGSGFSRARASRARSLIALREGFPSGGPSVRGFSCWAQELRHSGLARLARGIFWDQGSHCPSCGRILRILHSPFHPSLCPLTFPRSWADRWWGRGRGLPNGTKCGR